jgi:hypothetical protein
MNLGRSYSLSSAAVMTPKAPSAPTKILDKSGPREDLGTLLKLVQ